MSSILHLCLEIKFDDCTNSSSSIENVIIFYRSVILYLVFTMQD